MSARKAVPSRGRPAEQRHRPEARRQHVCQMLFAQGQAVDHQESEFPRQVARRARVSAVRCWIAVSITTCSSSASRSADRIGPYREKSGRKADRDDLAFLVAFLSNLARSGAGEHVRVAEAAFGLACHSFEVHEWRDEQKHERKRLRRQLRRNRVKRRRMVCRHLRNSERTGLLRSGCQSILTFGAVCTLRPMPFDDLWLARG